jgi:hypothetical protein
MRDRCAITLIIAVSRIKSIMGTICRPLCSREENPWGIDLRTRALIKTRGHI